MKYRDMVLWCLPGSKEGYFSTKEELIEEINNRIKNQEDSALSALVGDLVIEKLQRQPEEEAFSVTDYRKLKKNLSLIDDENMYYGLRSLTLCLTASNEMIDNELELIAKYFDNYPEVERIKDPITKIYKAEKRPIDRFDCYHLIKTLYSAMKKQGAEDAKKLYKKEEFFEVYDMVSEISKSDNEEEKQQLLKAFDSKFSFLTNSKLYKTMYEDFRNHYITELLNNIRKLYSYTRSIEDAKQQKLFGEYISQKSRSKRKLKGLY